ncbi:MAG: hypothetical protein ACI9RG_001324 [Sulfurimonas sp.]|jgi:hypothetical protein
MTKLKLGISALWIILTIAICWNIYSSTEEVKKITDTINIFLLMLGGYGVVFSIIHNTESIIENNKQMKEKMDIDKIENTFQLLRAWDDEHLFKARKFTREIGDMRDSISNEDLIKKIDSDPELRQSVILVLNYIENIRVSINYSRIDTEIFKKSLGPATINIINRFEPYIRTQGEQNLQDMQECKTLLS